MPRSLCLLLAALAACGDKDGVDDSAADDSAADDSAADDSAADDSAADDSAADDSAADDTGEVVGEPITLTFLHINDHHSHLSDHSFSFDVSGLGLSAEVDSVDVSYGGFPRLLTLLAEREGQVTNPIKLHAGDALTGTLYYTLFGGAADADMMNRACFDAFTLGNHEFDGGDATLAAFLDLLAVGPCETAVLSANLTPGPESPLNESGVLPYTLIERQGQQVAVIGLTIAQKTMVSSNPDDGTELGDEREAAQGLIDDLRGQGVDKFVLLTHTTYEGDLALAASLSGVDVIVGGDSHSLLAGSALDSLGFTVVGDYPTQVANADGEPVCVVQAWEYSRVLGELAVDFDAEGVVTGCAGHPWLPYGEAFSHDGGELDAADAALVSAALQALDGVVPVEEDAGALAARADYDAQVDVLENTIIGTVASDLCLERFPGQGRSSLCDLSETYAQGGQVANVVAKAFLSVSPSADLAIQNAGGVRIDLPSGDFSYGTAYTLLPFANTLVTLDLTGAQVVQVLEDALSNALDEGGSTGSYPYASALRFEVDASAAAGDRVSNVEVNPRLAGAWTPIDLGATYTVVTNSFIATGQDGYDTFGVIFDAGGYVDLYTEYAQGMVDHVEALTAAGQSLSPVPDEELSTQRYVGRDGCDHSARTDCSGY